MDKWQKLALVVATVALVGGALFAGVAYAQTPAPTLTPAEEQGQPPARPDGGRFGGWFGGVFGRLFGEDRGQGPGRMGRPGMGQGRGGPMDHGRGGPMGGPFAEDREAILAEALGMTSEELQSALDEGKSVLAIAEAQGLDETELQDALQAALTKRIDAAVEADDLTQSQADRLKEQLANGPSLLGMGMGGRGRPDGGALATIIGEPRELLLEATGLTSEELETALQTTITKRVDAAVEAGKITQAEADEILKHVDEGLPFFGAGKDRPADDDQQK